MRNSRLLLLICLTAFTLSTGVPAWADAAVVLRIQALTKQIELTPNNQILRLERAMAYIESNQPDSALSDILAAETMGDPVKAALTHGYLLYTQRDLLAARSFFDRYLQANPGHRSALEYRARALRDSGETRLALADYEYLIAHNSTLDPGYYLAAARLMAGLQDRGVDEALALLDARIQQQGQVTSLQRYAIDLEKNRGRYHGAIARMAGLDKRLKATAQWQAEVAELWLLAGQPDEALPYLSVAEEQLRSGRQTPVNRELLASVYRLQEQARREPNPAHGS
ncbi:MAG: hypothetical protein R3E64_16090 [Halioglobus sp.]